MSAPADLGSRARAATERALDSGALVPISTACERVSDAGLSFQLRVVDALRRKARARVCVGARPRNPFLVPEPALVVADVGPGHRCLLNKFNVLDLHLLLVTRRFVPQTASLTAADLGALWSCLARVDGLGFYNGGEAAGASQPHKHLQLAPYPLSEVGARPPIEDALEAIAWDAGGFGASDALPWPHAAARLADLRAGDPGAAPVLAARYRALLGAIGLEPPEAPEDAPQVGPYNLLLTRRWMCAVPRSRERFEGLSVNALGFAGLLLVRDAAERARALEVGPAAILQAVAGR